MTKQRRFMIFLVMVGCAMAALELLRREDFLNFYYVLIGLTYIWFDRIEKVKEKEDE